MCIRDRCTCKLKRSGCRWVVGFCSSASFWTTTLPILTNVYYFQIIICYKLNDVTTYVIPIRSIMKSLHLASAVHQCLALICLSLCQLRMPHKSRVRASWSLLKRRTCLLFNRRKEKLPITEATPEIVNTVPNMKWLYPHRKVCTRKLMKEGLSTHKTRHQKWVGWFLIGGREV